MSSVVSAALAIVRAARPDVPASTKVTKDPALFVRVSRAGGPRRLALDVPRVLVECYASTSGGSGDSVKAEELAIALSDAFEAAPKAGPWAGLWVTSWEPDTLTGYDNPDYPKHSRYQFSGSLYVLRR